MLETLFEPYKVWIFLHYWRYPTVPTSRNPTIVIEKGPISLGRIFWNAIRHHMMYKLEWDGLPHALSAFVLLALRCGFVKLAYALLEQSSKGLISSIPLHAETRDAELIVVAIVVKCLWAWIARSYMENWYPVNIRFRIELWFLAGGNLSPGTPFSAFAHKHIGVEVVCGIWWRDGNDRSAEVGGASLSALEDRRGFQRK
jgi:hypothetical protein